ncbi:MAG: hypothetical protein RR854_04370, partial [Muribaculaceae bacterium]
MKSVKPATPFLVVAGFIYFIILLSAKTLKDTEYNQWETALTFSAHVGRRDATRKPYHAMKKSVSI